MLKSLFLLLAISAHFVHSTQKKPLKILVYSPLYGSSHSKFMGSLADTLTESGHDVTYLVPIADPYGSHHHGVHLTKNVIIVPRDDVMEAKNVSNDGSTSFVWTFDNENPNYEEAFRPFTQMMFETCSNLMRNKNLAKQLRESKFDVALTEPLFACGLALFKAIGVERTILASSCSLYDFVLANIGESQELSFVPGMSSQTGDKMTIRERYDNYRLSEASRGAIERFFDRETALYREHLGQKMPDWREFFASASLYFTNSNPYIDFPRPVIQKTVAIGGISVDVEKIKSEKLSKEWNEVLDRRPRTMLISFGSMAKSREMPEEYRKNLLTVIKSEPEVTFIWKYESDDVSFADAVPNVHFTKWVPQTTLLADRRLTAFMTHGGLGSTLELAHCGTPALMIPLTFDQIRNSNMLVRHGSVRMLKKGMLGELETLRDVIRSILYDEKYGRNAKRLAALLSDQPFRPKDLLVKHTEFVGKHGPFPEMDPYVRQLNFFQRNLLDIFAIFAVGAFAVTTAILIIIRIVYSKLVSPADEKHEKDL